MENKKRIIITIATVVVVLIIAIFLIVINNNDNEKIGGFNTQEENLINDLDIVDATGLFHFDAEKIIEVQTIENENMTGAKASILESPDFSIPKDVSGIEMMTAEDKEALGIDQNLNIQVLGRNEAGQITGYQFINSEEDFILDLR